MARFCATKRILCFFPVCNLHNECRYKEVVQPIEDTDDEDTFTAAVGVGLAVASLFSGAEEPDGDTFTGNGGDFGGGGASDDF